MSIYLDASVLVPLLTKDALNGRARALLYGSDRALILSDFTQAEFSSSVSRRVRTRDLSVQEARLAFDKVEVWSAGSHQIETISADIRAAEVLIRRLDLPLRTPDALNIALAQRAGAALATFDRQMADSARRLGLEVVD